MSDISDSLESLRVILREEYPVEMELLSCKEAPHFFGYDIERGVEENLDYVPVMGEEHGLDFHCQINLHQEENDTVSFRHATFRFKNGKIVDEQFSGVPESNREDIRKRAVAMYHVIYPGGLTVEDMRE